MVDLIFTIGPGLAGLLIQLFFWRSLPMIWRGSVRADNGRLFERSVQPATFWTYVGIWIVLFLLSLALLFWTFLWLAYIVEYRH